MQLYFDPNTRALVGAGPDGTSMSLFAAGVRGIDLVSQTVSDTEWSQSILPAWSAAAAAGEDLLVFGDGTTSTQPHAPTLREQIAAFKAADNPQVADVLVVAKALITVLGY